MLKGYFVASRRVCGSCVLIAMVFKFYLQLRRSCAESSILEQLFALIFYASISCNECDVQTCDGTSLRFADDARRGTLSITRLDAA